MCRVLRDVNVVNIELYAHIDRLSETLDVSLTENVPPQCGDHCGNALLGF